MRRTFIAAIDHEVTGELGWQDSRIGYNNPVYGPLAGSPVGLAHDAFEHFTFQGPADECMALGAMYWIRYEGGYPGSGQYARPLRLEDFGSTFIDIHHACHQDDMAKAPRTKKLESHVESDLEEIVAIGAHYVIEEFPAEEKEIGESINANFRGWFRKGYRAAARKYGRMGMSACEVAWLFQQIEQALDGLRYRPDYEGQKLILNIVKSNFSLELGESEEYN